MSQHVAIAPEEAADRLAIRELVEAYACCADRRDAEGQMSLFTRDAHFVVYMDAKYPMSSQRLHSREALASVFADLNQYHATMQFVGQSTISLLSKEHASGQAYCLAYHLTSDGHRRRSKIATFRYLDTFAKVGGTWLFAERRLYIDWMEERSAFQMLFADQVIRVDNSAPVMVGVPVQRTEKRGTSASGDNDIRAAVGWVRHLAG